MTNWPIYRAAVAILSALQAHGYDIHKLTQQSAWEINRPDGSAHYLLIWLPRPVEEWALLPNDSSPEHQALWTLIQNALETNP
ncbi:hypothetical protein [Leptolyngbya sp. FACHB-261]|uniref:hypothetical protein n=1 Tax=Leptolyngbya sp. FACHB-261 TaxID=2692806 RepID=UPI00168A071A|nr:hypothetical protein [Leptolyngbya sp. FACHB-261]MBD2100282.1 hypothetical protein [Leptolyngbya sp. FACHB-261]